MDVLFFLLNGMSVFFGLGSLAFTITLAAVTKDRKLRFYSFIQLILIIPHGLYIFKADIPWLCRPAPSMLYTLLISV